MANMSALSICMFSIAVLGSLLTGTPAAVASPGAIVGWGDDFHGQVTPPDAVNGLAKTATHIAAGGYHSCAIQSATDRMI